MSRMIRIPPRILNQTKYRNRYSLLDLYRSYTWAPNALKLLRKNKASKEISPTFIERMQLAVTEVNGCAVCSYAHTKMALGIGMSETEIYELLGGKTQAIPPSESIGIIYAQHFADRQGFPEASSVNHLKITYGNSQALTLHAACQIMLAGNIYGLPLSSFFARFMGKSYKNSSIAYELVMITFGIIILPFALIHGLFLPVGLPFETTP